MCDSHKECSRSTSEELAEPINNLSVIGRMLAVLSVVPEYICQTTLSMFPQPTHKPKYVTLECYLMCVKVFCLLLPVKWMSRLRQDNKQILYKYRVGRVITSGMKAVCHMDSTNPSQSLMHLTASKQNGDRNISTLQDKSM